MKKDNLILPVSILLGSLIFGGFYYASQINKQRIIDKKENSEIIIRKDCYEDASEGARDLLKTKAELNGGYKKETEKNLFLKDDFNHYYEMCLSKNGLKK